MNKIVDAIQDAQNKLSLYRAKYGGEYVGGVEYMALQKRLENAVSLARAQAEELEQMRGEISIARVRFNRSVEVEQFLLDAARGKQPLPTPTDCAALARKLGVPI